MATSPNTANRSGAAAQLPSTPNNIIGAPYAVEGQKTCYICLQNENETPPNTSWVSACPCSLDAHESCMLRWIAEQETSAQGRRKPLQCPACKAPIVVEEPFDPIIALRNRVVRSYTVMSPLILLGIVGTGTVAGSAAYGSMAGYLFLGPTAFKKWLGPFPHALWQALKLSTIAPALLITYELPALVSNVFIIPAAFVSGMLRIAHDDLLDWPPTLGWAFSVLPLAHYVYNTIYAELFGTFERRLNRALRGRPMDEEPNNDAPLGRVEAAPANPNNNNNNNAGQRRQEEEAEESVLGSLYNVGRAVIGLLRDDDDENEEGGNNQPQEGGRQNRAGGVDAEVVVELELNLPGLGGGDNHQEQEEEEGEAGLAEELQQLLEQPAAPAPAPAPAPAAPAPRNQVAAAPAQPAQQQQPAPPRRNDIYEPSSISYIMSSLVTPLMFPAASYGMGEIIRRVVPQKWVASSSSSGRPGLLQERWGRSLVGGCLLVVAKDAVSLWIKYRRVQVKLNRRVRNVDKKRGGRGATA